MARSALAFVVVPVVVVPVLVGGGAVAQPAALPDQQPVAAQPPTPDLVMPATDVLAAPTPESPASPASASPAPADGPAPRWFERVTIGALVDGYVAAPLTGAVDAPSRLRVFDAANATFALAYAELTLALPAEPAGLRVDLGFGPVADLASLETVTTGTPPMPVTGTSEVTKHVQQAYASWKLPTATAIVVDAGKFVTSAGAEVIEAKDDWLYTRSLLFGYAIPFTHTGVRATATVTDTLAVQGLVANGWDVGLDNNRAKTFGASALYADAAAGRSATATVIVGKEAERVRVLADLVLGLTVGAVALNANVDVGKEGDAAWYGAALMARYAVSPRLRLSGRVEHFRDPDGARTAIVDGVAVTEATLGAAVPVGGNGELRLEGRVDHADADIYDADTASTHATVTAAALAWF